MISGITPPFDTLTLYRQNRQNGVFDTLTLYRQNRQNGVFDTLTKSGSITPPPWVGVIPKSGITPHTKVYKFDTTPTHAHTCHMYTGSNRGG